MKKHKILKIIIKTVQNNFQTFNIGNFYFSRPSGSSLYQRLQNTIPYFFLTKLDSATVLGSAKRKLLTQFKHTKIGGALSNKQNLRVDILVAQKINITLYSYLQLRVRVCTVAPHTKRNFQHGLSLFRLTLQCLLVNNNL